MNNASNHVPAHNYKKRKHALFIYQNWASLSSVSTILRSTIKQNKLRDMETFSSRIIGTSETILLQSLEHVIGQSQQSTKLYYMFDTFNGT